MTEIEDHSGAASPELERIAGDAAPITDENGAIEADDDLEAKPSARSKTSNRKIRPKFWRRCRRPPESNDPPRSRGKPNPPRRTIQTYPRADSCSGSQFAGSQSESGGIRSTWPGWMLSGSDNNATLASKIR